MFVCSCLGAGITSDVLEDMSIEEQQGTLKAILASNPALLSTLTAEQAQVVSRTRRGRSAQRKHTASEQEAESLSTRGHVTHIVHVDSSDSTSTHSSDSSLGPGTSYFGVVPQPGRQLSMKSPIGTEPNSSPSRLGDLAQMMSVDEQMDEQMVSPTSLKKPVQLVLDSDEEAVDEENVDEEPETQPYDQDCLLANSEVWPQRVEQELTLVETVPETQIVDSHPENSSQDEPMEIADLRDSIVKPVDVEQDVPLTRIYRAQRNPDKTFWPSLYAPSNVKDPNVYTDVIKLVFDLYMRRVCRAKKQIDQVARAWGKPVRSGCHMKGCLRARSSRLQGEPCQDAEHGRGRSLRRRLPQTQGFDMMNNQRNCDDDDYDDFDLNFSQTLKPDFDSHQRFRSENRRNLQAHDEGRSALDDAGCRQSPCRVTEEQDQYVVDKEDENDSDEWIPVKMTRGSGKRNAVRTGNQKQTQARERKKRKHVDKAHSNKINLSKDVASTHRKLRQVTACEAEDDTTSVDKCEFDAMLKGNGASLRQAYVWSDEENENRALVRQTFVWSDEENGNGKTQSGHGHASLSHVSKLSQGALVKVDRVDALDGKVGMLSAEMVVNEDLRDENSEGDKHSAVLMVDFSTSNKADSNLNDEDNTSCGIVDAGTVSINSSQSCESLLDAQGNLYSTQLCLSAHDPLGTDSHLAPTSSLQRNSSPAQSSLRLKRAAAGRETGTLSLDSQLELRPSKHGRLSGAAVKPQKHERLSVGEARPLAGDESRGMLSSLTSKPDTTGNQDRNNDESDDCGNVKACGTEVSDQVVMQAKIGDSMYDPKQESKRLRSNRCLKRNTVEVTLGEKRRKFDYSAEEKKSKISSEMLAAVSVESSPGGVDHSLSSAPGRAQLLQDEEIHVADSTCPICCQYFHPSRLEAHASSCGEDAEIAVEGEADQEMRCIKCTVKVPKEDIKKHQAQCRQTDVPVRRLTRSSKE
ncbi:hypothetical protein BsWGS_00954 [Bradybaena similaris]